VEEAYAQLRDAILLSRQSQSVMHFSAILAFASSSVGEILGAPSDNYSGCIDFSLAMLGFCVAPKPSPRRQYS
jgi:hypothetical protein